MSRRGSQAQNFIENLRDEVTLEMVFIPGGRFLMGSPGNVENFAYRKTTAPSDDWTILDSEICDRAETMATSSQLLRTNEI